MDQVEYAKLSGIQIPEKLLAAVAEAKDSISKIEERRAALEQERASLEAEARGLVSEEAQALVAGVDAKKLSSRRKKCEERAMEIGLLLAELEKLGASPQAQLRKAEEDLANHIGGLLVAGRKVMRQQVELAMTERGRNIADLGVFRSAPPEHSSRSRVATCEICSRDLAIFDPGTIRQPVIASHFQRLPPFDAVPFHPMAGIEHFRCCFCGKRPWSEADRILTNCGYFLVPDNKEENANG
jgi:hypothetical protein